MASTQQENPFFEAGSSPSVFSTRKAEMYLSTKQIDTIKRCNQKKGRIYLSELCSTLNLPFRECADILECGCYDEPTKECVCIGKDELEAELKQQELWEDYQEEYPEILPKLLAALDVLSHDGCDIIIFD